MFKEDTINLDTVFMMLTQGIVSQGIEAIACHDLLVFWRKRGHCSSHAKD